MRRTVGNLILSRLRKNEERLVDRFSELADNDIITNGPSHVDRDTGSGVLDEDLARAYDLASQRMSPLERGVWELKRRYLDEPHKDLAARLDISENTFNVALCRGRMKILAAYQELTRRT